jgi:hypothetical protein
MGLFDEVLDNVGEPYSGGGKGFEYGTHEVLIMLAEAKSKDTKKAKDCAIVEVQVCGKEDNTREATCTLWFHTEGAAKMSVTKVLGMIVHNVGEEKKDAVRELGKKLFGSIEDPIKARDVAAKLMQDKLITKEAYLVAEPQGKYSTTSYGDLWHYAAVPQNEPASVEAATGGEDITGTKEAENLPDFDDKKLEDL